MLIIIISGALCNLLDGDFGDRAFRTGLDCTGCASISNNVNRSAAHSMRALSKSMDQIQSSKACTLDHNLATACTRQKTKNTTPTNIFKLKFAEFLKSE